MVFFFENPQCFEDRVTDGQLTHFVCMQGIFHPPPAAVDKLAGPNLWIG